MSIILYEALFILLTGGAYLISKQVYRKFPRPYFHSILISVIIIIAFLYIFDIEYSFYYENTRVLRYILNISVVAFGYLLYVNIDFLKKNTSANLLANFIGSIIGVASVIGLSFLFGISDILKSTLIPKSITTPLAVEISASLGGITSLTAVIVVLCGLFGAIAGPSIFKYAKIKTPFAKGIALGTSAHGLGTAKALEIGALEGAIGGLSIGPMGFFTSPVCAVPSFTTTPSRKRR